jgi:cell division protein FtsZ
VQAVAPAPAPAPATDNRLADLTARLRADNAKIAERLNNQHDAPRAPEPVRAPVEQERATMAAVAAAVAQPPAPAAPATYGDVSIRPVPPKPTLFAEPRAEPIEHHEPAPAAFIPPAPEKMPARPTRMPKFEELPMPAQNEIRQARGEAPAAEHPQKNRLSLLQRLANVGLGRRDEETEPPIAARASGPAMPEMPVAPQQQRMPMPHRPVPQQRPVDPVSEYARRSPPQGLDSHGRPAPVNQQPQGEDHLDIPAFLRRQTN